MTVSSQIPYNAYTYAGSATFVYGFRLILATDLQVSVNGAIQPPGNYTTTGVGNQGGGSIAYTGTLNAGDLVELQRVTVLQRATDYQDEGDFLAATVNADYDRLWMALQEQQRNQAQTIRVPEAAGVPVLPAASLRLGTLLGFDAVTGALTLVAGAVGSALALAVQYASALGASLIGFIAAGIGAFLRTVQDKLRENVDVADYLPIGYAKNGTVDYNVYIQAAINALFTAGGGTLNFPAFPLSQGTTALNFKNNISYRGKNRKVSKLIYTGTTDQVVIQNTLNGSTDASINIEDLWLSATNLAAFNANLFDTGSSLLNIKRCMLDSNQLGLILDQTELATIEQTYFAGQTGAAAGAWLVNGADKNVGSLTGFTNRITFKDNQFNGSGAWIGVVDDGGNDHSYITNNFNAGTTLIRFAACAGFQVYGGEYEVWTGSGMIAAATKWKGATAFFSSSISFKGGFYFVPGTNAAIDVQVSSTPSVSIEDICFNTAGNPYANTANVTEIFAKGNTQGGAGSGYTAINNYFTGKAFTLTWSAGGTAPVLGNGTLTGTWSRQGRWNSFTINLVAGSTTTFGTGNWSFSVPVAEAGVGAAVTVSMVCAGAFYTAVGRISGSTLNSIFSASNTGAAVSVTVPGAWTTANSLVTSGGYLSSAPI